MKSRRFWRNLWTVVGVTGVVIGIAALVLPDHGTGFKPYVALAVPSLAIAVAALIGAYQQMRAVQRFDQLDRGDAELARWRIDPPTWRQFAVADKARQAGLDRLWGENILAVADDIAAPLEIVVSQEAVRVGEAYHELDRGIMLGTRYMPGTPVMLEFYFRIVKPRGAPMPFIVRLPVEAGAEQRAQAVLAHFNHPRVLGRVERIINAPFVGAQRNPRGARNIALRIAGVAAAVGAGCIFAADAETMRGFDEEEPGAVLMMVTAAIAPVIAVAATILAAVWHIRASRAS